MKWLDQYSGKSFRISASQHFSSRQTASVKTFGDVISEYEFHAEPKCADSKGNICEKNTRGLLKRRHVAIDRIRFIGKESNELEEIDAGLIHSAADAYTEFIDPRRDDWERKVRPTLKQISLSKLCVETGFSRRALINWRTGKSRPHLSNLRKLISTWSVRAVDYKWLHEFRNCTRMALDRFDQSWRRLESWTHGIARNYTGIFGKRQC